jgi:CBS domain-containing protein
MPRVARDLMQAPPLTVAADTSLVDVQHVLVLARAGGMPVVDHDGSVLGMIDALDVLRAFDDAFDSPDPLGQVRTLTARDVFAPDPVWIDPDTSATQIAEVMQREKVERVLVGIAGQLLGVVAAGDLLPDVA